MVTDVQLCVTFPLGSLVRLTANFSRPPTQAEIDDGTADSADDWQAIDPDTVSILTMDPDGDVEQHDYNGSPGDVVRYDVGVYYVDVTPTLAGSWVYRAESTGNGQAGNEHIFKVAPSAFP